MLNYIATSNHIHMLVLDTGEDVIPKSLQLVAGRTAQEYNIRKKRKGAFWEDRYHATAVQSDEHLVKCLVYIDLNMVRAGVVRHPSEYAISGYNEIQTPPKRYSIVNQQALHKLLGVRDGNHFRQMHRDWVELELKNVEAKRQSFWSESIAVGDEGFIKNIQQELSGRIPGRSIVSENGTTALREPQLSYSTLFEGHKGFLSTQNAYLLELSI